jgi:hypothetical protein
MGPLCDYFIQVGLPGVSDVQLLMWRIEDSVVQLKRLIAEVVVTWNGKIQDLVLINKRRDERHRKNDGGKPSAPPASSSVECDVVSFEKYIFIGLFTYLCTSSSSYSSSSTGTW